MAVLGGLTAFGTIGYVLVAGAHPVDALYMTVTTLSTVGFGEIVPLGTTGRIFTMLLIVGGVGTFLYLITAVAELVIEGRLRGLLGRTTMQRTLEKLRDHVVVCGYGRLGRVVVDELRRSQLPVVVIDVDPGVAAELADAGIPHIIGSALSDAVLERAGIQHARAIAVATPSDADNVFVTLSAREKHPGIRIHARAESEAGVHRLRLAGADQVLSAYQAGGLKLASSILRPTVVDFLELTEPGRSEEMDFGEVRVEHGSALPGRTLRELEASHQRLRVVALRRGATSLDLVPDPETVVREGDHLVVIGARPSLATLAQRAQSARRAD